MRALALTIVGCIDVTSAALTMPVVISAVMIGVFVAVTYVDLKDAALEALAFNDAQETE